MLSTVARTSRRSFASIPLVLILVLCIPGCSQKGGDPFRLPPPAPGKLIEYTGCKNFLDYPIVDPIGSNQDCLVYDYDGAGRLALTHVNAGFNCCPGEITADITIDDAVITIVEHESQSACRCLCLNDLQYEFTDLDPGVYTIRVVEPYVGEPYGSPSDEPLECTIDLTAAVEGQFCIERNHYPWDTGTGGGPAGTLIGYHGCKEINPIDGGAAEDFADIDCIEYEYFEDNILALRHINAGFNCCPEEITADITIEGDVITITEHEAGAFCDCSCLFDVSYEIRYLPPGTYTIRVVELYLIPGDEPLEFTADLESYPYFRYCVDRNHYPWQSALSEQEDIDRLKRLEAEIMGIIGTPTCSGEDACRIIAFGDKPCGGPWRFLIYSTESTDVELLVRKVFVYNIFNRVLNYRYGWMSDCSIAPVPNYGCRDGVCVDLDLNE
jgi:hypothetical protein